MRPSERAASKPRSWLFSFTRHRWRALLKSREVAALLGIWDNAVTFTGAGMVGERKVLRRQRTDQQKRCVALQSTSAGQSAGPDRGEQACQGRGREVRHDGLNAAFAAGSSVNNAGGRSGGRYFDYSGFVSLHFSVVLALNERVPWSSADVNKQKQNRHSQVKKKKDLNKTRRRRRLTKILERRQGRRRTRRQSGCPGCCPWSRSGCRWRSESWRA